MSFLASIGKPKPNISIKIERVKGALEHIALYVCLAVYTAVGAKVRNMHGILGCLNLFNVLILKNR